MSETDVCYRNYIIPFCLSNFLISVWLFLCCYFYTFRFVSTSKSHFPLIIYSNLCNCISWLYAVCTVSCVSLVPHSHRPYFYGFHFSLFRAFNWFMFVYKLMGTSEWCSCARAPRTHSIISNAQIVSSFWIL